MGKGYQEQKRAKTESSSVAVTAVERAAINKSHRAYKPCSNDRQADTIHVKDANCAVTASSCGISPPYPFSEPYYSAQGGVSIGQSVYFLLMYVVFSMQIK